MLKVLKASFLVVSVVSMSACVSLDGQMVDAEGNKANCSRSGGGVGLGMVVGAAIAAADNQYCESKFKEKGFIHVKNVGKSGIAFDEQATPPIVLNVTQPASNCLMSGDTVLSVDGKDVMGVSDTQRTLFKKAGESVSIVVLRGGDLESCEINLI